MWRHRTQQPEVRGRMCWKSGEVWKPTKHALNCTLLLSYHTILMFLVQTFSCLVAMHGHITIETKNKKTDARRPSLVFSAALLQLRSIVCRPPLPRATRVVHFCRATIVTPALASFFHLGGSGHTRCPTYAS
jgi:hypothetical protein